MSHNPQHPRIIGLTGSIGSGKSTVASMLRKLGYLVLDADALAREASEVLLPEICQQFPDCCEGGQLNRAKLALRMFSEPVVKERLEGLIHPYVRQRMAQQVQEATAAGAQTVIQDIPLLFESRDPHAFDGVLVVAAPLEQRIQRVMSRSNLAREQVLARDAAQLAQEDKIKQATWVIWNSGGLDELEEQVKNWSARL